VDELTHAPAGLSAPPARRSRFPLDPERGVQDKSSNLDAALGELAGLLAEELTSPLL
jgi:hypothetical protein